MQNLWRQATPAVVRGDRWIRRGLLATVVYNLAFVAWVLARPGSQRLFTGVDDIGQALGIVLLAPLGLYGLRRVGRGERTDWAPILLATGAVAFAVGEIIWTFYEQVLGRMSPFPSLADVGFLLQYPFLIVGVLLLPRRSLGLTTRVRVFLDGLITMAGVFTFSWYFILGPTMLQGGESPLAKMIGTAYPLWDLVVIACLVLLVVQAGDPALRPAVTVLGLGLGIVVISDSVFDYQTLHNAYATGSIIDVGWSLGGMLTCLAAGMAGVVLAQRRVILEAEPDQLTLAGPGEDRPPAWRSLLPYAVVPLVGALTIAAAHHAESRNLEPVLYVGAGVLVLLVFIRQVAATAENRRLYRRLRTAYGELGSKNHDLSEANRRLQTLATSDPLTELPNHRGVVGAIDREIERGRRYGRQFSVLFIDLDHFKRVNDAHGHLAGDEVLREVGGTLQGALRSVDTLGRWGGEEFLAILPEVDLDTALQVVERVREAIAAHEFVAAPARLTCSVGIACFPDDATDREGLVDAADRAMYTAKHLGRNKGWAEDDPTPDAQLAETIAATGDEALANTIEGLSGLIAGRAHYTSGHATHLSALATRIALALGMERDGVAAIKIAARLHDIGKVAVPDSVLLNPGRLNDDEWMLMRRHPIVGADIVGRIHGLAHLAPIVRSHHERWDGAGYPDGLVGEEIPLGGRILAVADAYEAMTEGRAYQQAREPEWALAELRRCAGSQFDPAVVAAIERVIQAEPLATTARRHAV